MIIVDEQLRRREEQGDPIRVGLVGAGFMAAAIVRHIERAVPGMQVVGIANRTSSKAMDVFRRAGHTDIAECTTPSAFDDAIVAGRVGVSNDPRVICESKHINVIVEVTGSIDFAANVALSAIDSGKPVILMNAELDGTLGPILQRYAAAKNVILSACDGDQPGVQMNLIRFVRGLGLTPRVAGNIKGFENHHATPETQEGFARQWNQGVRMVTSFCDGTKIAYEQLIVANAAGLRIPKGGLRGKHFDGHVDDLATQFAERDLGPGIVDYVVGAKPAPGVYVFAATDDEETRTFLKLYKLGDGPLYSFYAPYHLCHLEVPNSIARVVLCNDSVMHPIGLPVGHVATIAKTDLDPGDRLDGIGGFTTYGVAYDIDEAVSGDMLPMGLSEGAVLGRRVARDQIIRWSDVAEMNEGRALTLWQEQTELRLP